MLHRLELAAARLDRAALQTENATVAGIVDARFSTAPLAGETVLLVIERDERLLPPPPRQSLRARTPGTNAATDS